MFNKISFINQIKKIEKQDDGSYIVIKNDMPYHIPNNDEYRQEYDALEEYILENNIQVDKHIPKAYKVAEDNLEEYIRSKRDNLLREADIILLKYQEQAALGIIEENQEYYNALLQYKQTLRDITKQLNFPNDVIFPILPEYYITL